MKILFVDRFLKGKAHANMKEGFSLYHAAIEKGVECNIAGKDCEIPERLIPEIANNYDLIVVSENYPNAKADSDGQPWSWWKWKDIKTPKLFWAIDTHLHNYRPFVRENRFDYVALNNKSDIGYYAKKNFFSKTPYCFFLPLAIQKDIFSVDYVDRTVHDISFIGSVNSTDRSYYINKYGMNHKEAFGVEYVKAMQESKICFNCSLSYDLNCKYFEILGSGSFLLSNNSNDFMYELFESDLLRKCIWNNEEEFCRKLKYYIQNNDERKDISLSLREYVLANHTYNDRLEKMLVIINEI